MGWWKRRKFNNFVLGFSFALTVLATNKAHADISLGTTNKYLELGQVAEKIKNGDDSDEIHKKFLVNSSNLLDSLLADIQASMNSNDLEQASQEIKVFCHAMHFIPRKYFRENPRYAAEKQKIIQIVKGLLGLLNKSHQKNSNNGNVLAIGKLKEMLKTLTASLKDIDSEHQIDNALTKFENQTLYEKYHKSLPAGFYTLESDDKSFKVTLKLDWDHRGAFHHQIIKDDNFIRNFSHITSAQREQAIKNLPTAALKKLAIDILLGKDIKPFIKI
jgi:hypothetical protein